MNAFTSHYLTGSLAEMPSQIGLKAPVGYTALDEFEVERRLKIKEMTPITEAPYKLPAFEHLSFRYSLMFA